MNKQMHLTGFMIYCPAPHMIMSWVYPREQIRHQWHETDYWVEIAQTLERGKLEMFSPFILGVLRSKTEINVESL
ncbi:MAG: hypothetical protein ACOY17_08925 [Pseudomonadota bacterium]